MNVTVEACALGPSLNEIEIILDEVQLHGSRLEFGRFRQTVAALSVLATCRVLNLESAYRLQSALECIDGSLEDESNLPELHINLPGPVFETVGEAYKTGRSVMTAFVALGGIRDAYIYGEFSPLFRLQEADNKLRLPT